MDKLASIKIKQKNGTYTAQVPIGVFAQNVQWDGSSSLLDILGSIDIKSGGKGNVQHQFDEIYENIDIFTDNIDNQITDFTNNTNNQITNLTDNLNDQIESFTEDTNNQITNFTNQTNQYLSNILGNIDTETKGTVQSQMNELYDSMRTFHTQMAGTIAEDVSTWLNQNVNPVGSAIMIDNTLTVSGAAADAKTTGDALNNLGSSITFKKIIDFTQYGTSSLPYGWQRGYYANENEALAYHATNYFLCTTERNIPFNPGVVKVKVIPPLGYNVQVLGIKSDGSIDTYGNANSTSRPELTNVIVEIYAQKYLYYNITIGRAETGDTNQKVLDENFCKTIEVYEERLVIDDTLTLENYAAEAKSVGDNFNIINNSLQSIKTNYESIVYNSFSKGMQARRYHVGQVMYFVEDTTEVRAINETPINFFRKTYLTAPAGYEFATWFVTSDTDLTVLFQGTYTNMQWIESNSYAIFQIRRVDTAALSDNDMEIINAWINFDVKRFQTEDIRRVCASKKTYHDGIGAYHSNNHALFTIAHLTDIHTDVIRYINFRQFVDENTDLINCAILTGDYVDNQNDAQWLAMNGVTGEKEILQVVGNHDAGHQAGDTLLNDAELVEKFGITTNTGKMYYYVDYDNSVRIIVLNQFEGTTKGNYVYNAEEITWLLEVLDDSITNNKHVIIACHLPDTFPVINNKGFYQRFNRWAPTTPSNKTMESGLEEIIDAFKQGTSVQKTLTNNISVDHTFSAKGDFICWICGHYHGDYIGYSETYPNQLYLLGNCGVCQSLPFKTTFMGETNSDLARIPKTSTEDCFNCYSFDFEERAIKIVKIGANINDQFLERKFAIFNMDGE